MAKLSRESRLRERRLEKEARKAARKLEPAPDQMPVDAVLAAPSDAIEDS